MCHNTVENHSFVVFTILDWFGKVTTNYFYPKHGQQGHEAWIFYISLFGAVWKIMSFSAQIQSLSMQEWIEYTIAYKGTDALEKVWKI